MSETHICVGVISGAYGVKGDVRLKSFCSDPAAIADYAPLTTESGGQSFGIRLNGPLKNAFSARLTGIATKEQADALKGTRLFAPRDRLPTLEDDEFYHSDLVGLDVIDTGGRQIGRIKSVHDHGAGDLLDVHGAGLGNGVLLPFTRENVPTVDIAGRRVIINPPDGLFPEPDEAP